LDGMSIGVGGVCDGGGEMRVSHARRL
jgi:hypothetical protein